MKNKKLSYYFLKNETTRRFYETSATMLGLVSSFFIISSLSVFHFGMYQLMLSLIAILEGFSAGFFNDVVVVEIRRYINTGKVAWAKRLFWEHVVLKLVMTLSLVGIIFGGATTIAHFYGDNVALFLKIASALLVIHTLRLLQSTLLKPVLVFSYWAYPMIMESVKLVFIVGLVVFAQLAIVNVIAVHVLAELAALIIITLHSFIKTYRIVWGAVAAQPGRLLFDVLRTHGKWIFVRYGFSKITKNTMPWFIKFFINTEAVAFYSLAVNLVSMIEKLMPLQGFGDVMILKIDNKNETAFIFKRAVKYLIWVGVIFSLGALIMVPAIISFIFPKYTPAMAVFVIMLPALPLFGVYKILKSTLSILREYRTLALRLANEVLVFPVGSVIFLPFLGLAGAGVVYVIAYLERVWFFYGQLVKKYPEFKIKAISLVRFDSSDKELIWKVSRQLALSFKSFFLRT